MSSVGLRPAETPAARLTGVVFSSWCRDSFALRRAGTRRGRSGKKSRPRAISITFFAAPMPGSAFSPVSSAPLMTPFRLIVATTVAAAIAAPRIGIDRETRRDSRAAPHSEMFGHCSDS